jgi:enoyl-CoA hydratase/carnithine racemase
LCSDTLSSFASLPIPVIAVVNGLAAAAGCQLVASCDLAIATQKSSFSTPGVKWGLFCTTPGVAVVRSMTSQKKALEMLLLGEPITAQEAYNFGLINKVVKEEELEQETKKYAEAISKLSSEVIALGKKAYWEQRSKNTLSEAYKSAVAAMCLNLKTEDTKEGLKAFSEKRHPHFKN